MKKKLLKDVNWNDILPNIPIATIESNGLMASGDKLVTPTNRETSGYPLYRIIEHSKIWSRHSAIVWGSFEQNPVCYIIGSYYQQSTLLVRIKSLGFNREDVKFFQKDHSVYCYINNPAGSVNRIMGISSTGIQAVSYGTSPDDSYTEVIPE